MLKRATLTINKLSKKYIFNSVNTLKEGGGIASIPFIIEFDLQPNEILEKILQVLDFSNENVSRPQDWKEFQKQYLNSMEVKTLKALHEGAVSLGVTLKDDTITFSPTHNKGSKKGFTGIGLEEKVSLPLSSPKKKLIESLELALSKCK